MSDDDDDWLDVGMRAAFGSTSPETRRPLPKDAPREIAGYRILGELGSGGMGIVYEAEHASTCRRVALKVARSAIHPEGRARFEYESQLLGQLQHPAIAEIYASGSFDVEGVGALPFFAMALVDDARGLIRYANEELLDVDERVELFIQVLEGVAHGHERGVVHRDIKPNNLLVDSGGCVRIIDFGLARTVASDDELASMHARSGELLGTPQYMSPEQWLGDLMAVGPSTDIYSLGVMLFELLSGRRPHDLDGRSLSEMKRIVCEQSPMRMARETGNWRRDLDVIVSKAIAREPDRRYARVADFRDDLTRYRRRERIAARPATVSYRVQTFARRHRTFVAVAAIVSMAMIVATAVSVHWALLARDRAHELEHQLHRSTIRSAGLALADARYEPARAHLSAVPPAKQGWVYDQLASRLGRSLTSPLPATIKPARVSISPDGTLLRASVLSTGPTSLATAVIDLQTGVELARLPREKGAGWFFLDDNTFLEMAADGQVRHWDARTGERLLTKDLPPTSHIRTMSVHPVAPRYVLATGGLIEVHSAYDDRVLFKRETSNLAVSAAYSSDGAWLAFSVQDDVMLVDAFDHHEVRPAFTLEERQSFIRLVFHPTKPFFVGGSYDGRVHLFEVTDDALVRLDVWDLPGRSPIEALAWSPDGLYVAAASLENARLWHVASSTVVETLPGHTGRILSLAFLPTGELLSTDETRQLMMWEGSSASSTTLTHSSYVYAAAVSPDGKRIVTGGWDGLVGSDGAMRLWDAASGAAIASWGGDGEVVRAVEFREGGDELVVSVWHPHALQASVRVLNARTLEERLRFEGHHLADDHKTRPVDQILEHPDGEHLLTFGEFGSTYLWHAETGAIVNPPDLDPNPTFGARRAAFAPDGKTVAITVDAKRIAIADATTFRTLREWEAHVDTITHVSFSPDGQRVFTSSLDDTAAVWRADTGERIATLESHGSDVFTVSPSPDGTHLITGGRDGNIRLWDAQTFEEITILGSHDEYVYGLSWSPDGEWVVSASGDSTARVWDTKTLAERHAALVKRRALVAHLTPTVTRQIEELGVAQAVALIAQMPELSEREREVALQLVTSHAAAAAIASRR